MFEVICISFAFFFGLAVKQIGLPPLVGFLAAGFAIFALSEPLGLPHEATAILDHISHLGVLLLLFAVGLKLRISQVLQTRVAGSAFTHFAISTAILTAGTFVLPGIDPLTGFFVAMALGFSSTVLSAKMLEAKRELVTFHGRVAIGILVFQDLMALAVLSAFGGEAPSPWALLIFGLPLLRPVVHWLLDLTSHDELLILVGMLLALVIGGMGFQTLGLSAELGALLMGVVLAGHKRAAELSDALWGLKEIFLVGFFLKIGMSGLPTLSDFGYALLFTALLPLKCGLFFFLLAAFGLRARNAFLSAISLTAYSEFGLIVIERLAPDWLIPLALAVSMSFVIAAPLNAMAHRMFEKFEPVLMRFQRPGGHPDELPVSLGTADILIFGMGRTGVAAYETMSTRYDRLIGLDADAYCVAKMHETGRNVLLADATDTNFWHGINVAGLKAVILAMDDLGAKVQAAQQLRARGFTGPVIAHALYEDHIEKIEAAGADHVYLTMYEAGTGLATRTLAELDRLEVEAT